METSVVMQPPVLATTVSEVHRPTPLRMSYVEFLNWAGEDKLVEWTPLDSEKGVVIVAMPPKVIHQVVLFFLSRLLGLFVDMLNLGKVCVAPLEVKLHPQGSAREPDIFFVAREHLNRLTADRFEGPPDLVVEIVSQDSVKRDRSDKLWEYQKAGVREYWIIDPREGHQRADFYALDEANEYQLFATDEDETVASTILPGFWLKPAWLWQADDLNPLALLFEMRGMSSEQIAQLLTWEVKKDE